MITYLKGKIQYLGSNFLEVNVNDLGYKVFSIGKLLDKLKVGQEIELFTYQYIREDALDLFGFKSREELDLFEQLNSVTGIGPKTALGVLSLASPEEIESAIVRDDASVLTKVSGIGKKTAERIVLELKSKYKGKVDLCSRAAINSEDSDVLDAMVGLGYQLSDAREALRKLDKDVSGADEKIKACLKLLAK
ncbi:MAG: Holliday junction branch migration protein RuvA [Patescibacteria group bacterium]